MNRIMSEVALGQQSKETGIMVAGLKDEGAGLKAVKGAGAVNVGAVNVGAVNVGAVNVGAVNVGAVNAGAALKGAGDCNTAFTWAITNAFAIATTLIASQPQPGPRSSWQNSDTS
jgi:hypothetical protein